MMEARVATASTRFRIYEFVTKESQSDNMMRSALGTWFEWSMKTRHRSCMTDQTYLCLPDQICLFTPNLLICQNKKLVCDFVLR